MNRAMIAMLTLTALLTACGDKRDAPARQESPAAAPSADEAQVQREADQNRKRFMGDGKSQYTPQRVEGF